MLFNTISINPGYWNNQSQT